MITDNIDICVEKLTNEDLVAFPTETVFGLGARADRSDAVQKIFDVKGRPNTHPLISHTSDIDQALSISRHVPEYANDLARKLWPGPLTLVLHCDQDDLITPLARGGHDSVAVRVPNHPQAQALLERCDFFVAAPSANRFGRVSPTKAEHVLDEFGEMLTILAGGQSEVGIESTIISCLGDQPQILRAGKITEIDIREITGLDVELNRKTAVQVPGSLEHHYAPSIPVYVFENEVEIASKTKLDPSKSAFISLDEPDMVFALQKTPRDVNEYAYELYDLFRDAEDKGCEAIFAIKPPNVGIGKGINDRLARAAKTFSGENDV